ncbi:MAG: peptide chain release factor-like protein [Chlamydiota bacterium]
MSEEESLLRRMELLGIRDEDLIEKFILGSGRGGQKINKTSSCVYLKHIPSGIEVKCQEERSREHNRIAARTMLCERLEKEKETIRFDLQQIREKKRRQKRPRTRKMKEKMLVQKKQVSVKKTLRKPPKDFFD